MHIFIANDVSYNMQPPPSKGGIGPGHPDEVQDTIEMLKTNSRNIIEDLIRAVARYDSEEEVKKLKNNVTRS